MCQLSILFYIEPSTLELPLKTMKPSFCELIVCSIFTRFPIISFYFVPLSVPLKMHATQAWLSPSPGNVSNYLTVVRTHGSLPRANRNYSQCLIKNTCSEGIFNKQLNELNQTDKKGIENSNNFIHTPHMQRCMWW